MKKLVLVLIGIIFCSVLVEQKSNAQDIHFSQYYASPMTLNPAMTGMMQGCYRGAINFRNQWSSIPAPFTTIALSYDMNLLRGMLGNDFIGVGILFFNDRAGYGNLNNMSILGSLAYHKGFDKAGRFRLSAGFQGGLVSKSVDFAKLIFESQLLGSPDNPQDFPNFEPYEGNTISYFDMRAGGMISATPINRLNFYLGVAMYHLSKPKESFLGDETNFLDQRLVIHGGANIRASKEFSIVPNVIYMTQTGSDNIVAGVNLGYHFSDGRSYRNSTNTAVYFGASVRLATGELEDYGSRDIIALLGIDYNEFKFGLSYDINVSDLSTASNGQGGIELSLNYEVGCEPPTRRTFPPVHCPRF